MTSGLSFGHWGMILTDNSCDQCVALMINGVFCHETGCPNQHKVKVDGSWVYPEDDPDDEGYYYDPIGNHGPSGMVDYTK